MDFKNAPKKRTSNFREDETKLLIQLWGSPTVQNKLYLTHRKAPVMRLIAANMQKHGFYRTPDEIKTRIRNLKCLYHRIKKSMTTGQGIGTVDPDWPHYKAMDDILSKKNALRQSLVYNHNLLSEVSATEVKEEIEDIDVNDDAESNTSNSNGSDDEFEETAAMPATITPLIIEEEGKINTPIKIAPKPSAPIPSAPLVTTPQPIMYPRIQIAQNLHNTSQAPPTLTARFPVNTSKTMQTIQGAIQSSLPSNLATISPKIQTTNAVNKTNGSSLPFPLLILNGMSNGGIPGQNGTSGLLQKAVPIPNNGSNTASFNAEVSSILKEMLDIQKENLEIEKERLEVEKQKLDFERTVGSQLLSMTPMFNEIFYKFKDPYEASEDTKNFVGHPNYNKNVTNGQKRPAGDSPESINNAGKFLKQTKKNGLDNSDTDGDSGIVNDSV